MNVMDTRATSAMLYLDGVHVSFDGFHAINNLSLTIAPGEMRAIIGPNGAGKTTMMDIITGKTRPDDGEVYFDGRTDLTKLDEAQIAGLQQIIRDTGALDRVEELITRTVADADAALRDAPLGVEATRWLRELAHDATTRTA